MREAVRLDPTAGTSYAGVVYFYLSLNRLEEGRATAEEAQAKNLDSTYLRFALYMLAFLQNDTAGMAQQVAWAAGKPGVENVLLANEADTAAYSGRLGKARELSQQAVASAERAQERETAARYEADAALREALFGNAAEARDRAGVALGLSAGRDVQYGAALALALGGATAREQVQEIEKLADDLVRRFPEDTVVRFNHLPTIRASSLSTAMMLRRPSRLCGLPLLTNWGHPPLVFSRPLCILSMCGGKPIAPRIRAAKPRPSFRKFWTTAVWCSMNPSVL